MHTCAREKADCFSFGVVLWQCLTRVQPWTNVKDIKMLKQLVVEQAKRPLIPDPCPAALRALIERCWAQQPEARPAFDAILEQVFWVVVLCSLVLVAHHLVARNSWTRC